MSDSGTIPFQKPAKEIRTETQLDASGTDHSKTSDHVDPAELKSVACMRGERVAFTGTLASMTHAKAADLVQQHEGEAVQHVGRNTTLLVVGEEGWPLEEDGTPAAKLQQAIKLRSQGADIRILKESEWLHALGLQAESSDIRRLYTPAMLSKVLGWSVHQIRKWERAGFIRPVKRVYRLPYFNFQEVTRARRLVTLLSQGIDGKQLQASLDRLKALLREADCALDQLEVFDGGKLLVYRDRFSPIESTTGQRLMDFRDLEQQTSSANHDSGLALVPWQEAVNVDSHSTQAEPHQPLDWFVEGCRALEGDDLPLAIDYFRKALLRNPNDAEAHFQLADALYRSGNVDGAFERYSSAIEQDQHYIEAWTQLGCLHAENGQPEQALQAFDEALELHPEFAEPHIHKAEVLHEMDRTDEAIDHWTLYLEHEPRGSWNELARQRLRQLGFPVEETT